MRAVRLERCQGFSHTLQRAYLLLSLDPVRFAIPLDVVVQPEELDCLARSSL